MGRCWNHTGCAEARKGRRTWKSEWKEKEGEKKVESSVRMVINLMEGMGCRSSKTDCLVHV